MTLTLVAARAPATCRDSTRETTSLPGSDQRWWTARASAWTEKAAARVTGSYSAVARPVGVSSAASLSRITLMASVIWAWACSRRHSMKAAA